MDYKDTYIMYNSKRFYDYYVFVDLEDMYSRNIFYDNGINVRILSYALPSNSKYRIYKCRTLRKNREIFSKCMEKLCNKMLIMRNTDYIEFSNRIVSFILGKKYNERILECTGLIDKSYIVSIYADDINHKDFIVISYDEDSSYRDISEKVKFQIDINGLGYKTLIIKVRKLSSSKDEEQIFTYINK